MLLYMAAIAPGYWHPMHSQTLSRAFPSAPPRRLPGGVRGACLALLALLGLVALAPAHAVEIEGIADARVEVRGQGERERARGFRRGLEQVVVRMTGNSRAPGNPDLESLFANPGAHVQTFRYRRLDDEKVDADADDPPTHELQVVFNAGRIEQALRDAEVPVWSRRRPEVLLWVGVDEGRERYLVGEQDGADARTALREQAQVRGLPLLLPLLDVEDRDRIDFIDIRAPFLEAIERAAERYRSEMILVGHVSRRGEEEWTADWTLLVEDRETTWSSRADALDAVLGAGIDGATDRLSALLAPREGDAERVYVTIEAIRSHGDYSRVAEYLADLARVERAEIVRLAADTARFRVDLRGQATDFERAVSAGRLLDPVPSPAVGVDLVEPTVEEDDVDALDALVDDLLGAPDNGRAADPSAPADVDRHGDATADDAATDVPVIELFYRFAG